mmetsp:Transcript_102905/g.330159  ORF Transcript_102905/g.330159 Transcript_102905/m.330159 type:complete len:90 (-) Transcript_102905:37-306(-)
MWEEKGAVDRRAGMPQFHSRGEGEARHVACRPAGELALRREGWRENRRHDWMNEKVQVDTKPKQKDLDAEVRSMNEQIDRRTVEHKFEI